MIMECILKSLHLEYFKGAKDRSIGFTHDTVIEGANETGKTTLADAYHWLLFDKDSTGRSAFNLKTLDENGQPIPQVDHVVTGEFINNGEPVQLKKVFKEKWQKKRGSESAEFTGHETIYYYNEVPCKQSEYQAKVSEMINESLFKLITNPFHFTSRSWQDQRTILTNMAGRITNQDVVNSSNDKEKFTKLLDALSGKTVSEYKKEIAAKKKKIKDDLENIPARIDEVHKGMPQEKPWGEIELNLEALKLEIGEIEEQIADRSKVLEGQFKEKENLMQQIGEKRSQVIAIEQAAAIKVAEIGGNSKGIIGALQRDIDLAKQAIANRTRRVKAIESEVMQLDEKAANLRSDFAQENAKQLTFDEHDFVCPTCKRHLDQDDIEARQEEMVQNFNLAKAAKLEGIRSQGKSIVAQIGELNGEKDELVKSIEEHEISLQEFTDKLKEVEVVPDQKVTKESLLAGNQEYHALKAGIEQLTEIYNEPINDLDKDQLSARKSERKAAADQLQTELYAKEVIEKGQARITELTAEQKKLSQQLASFERTEFVIAEFEKAHIDLVESRVNDRFSMVKFKLFNQQINGGLEPTCECTYKGVPYSDLNNAGKINAGLDIINTLCDHYNVYAPVFIDNAEAVNEFIPVKSQLVKLVVTSDPVLTVAPKVNKGQYTLEPEVLTTA
jgi:DNA repair protein SbcC/Rad50